MLVRYSTTDACTALQWLEPRMTADKTHPYMFSQCQALHARTMFPCQDTPSVKQTYTALVTVPEALTALMSAVSDPLVAEEARDATPAGWRSFAFEQLVGVGSRCHPIRPLTHSSLRCPFHPTSWH